MKLVYICSPLRGDIESNLKRADRCCEYAANCGVIPIAPHLAWQGFLREDKPGNREKALALGLGLMTKADELWVCGSEISQGMQCEIQEAERLKLPTLYILDETIEQGLKVRQTNDPLGKEDCLPESGDMYYDNCILVMNPESLKHEFRNAENSLWFATHGPGCKPSREDRTVHAINLYDGRSAAFGRYQFHGVVKPDSLDKWMNDIPVKNNLTKYAESVLSLSEGLEV